MWEVVQTALPPMGWLAATVGIIVMGHSGHFGCSSILVTGIYIYLFISVDSQCYFILVSGSQYSEEGPLMKVPSQAFHSGALQPMTTGKYNVVLKSTMSKFSKVTFHKTNRRE